MRSLSAASGAEAAGTVAGDQACRVVRTLDEGPWSAFVEGHPAGSIFHTPEMHRVFAETRHHAPAVWATIDAAGEIRALIAPVQIATVGGPLRVLTTRTVSFSGPLVAPGGRGSLEGLLRAYQRGSPRTAVFTEFRNPTDVSDLAPVLAAVGFRHEPHLNFLVDLTPSEDDLWRRISPSARRNVQKAHRLGVLIDEVADPSGIAAGYEVLRDVYRRIRVPLPDRSLFDTAFRILGPLGRFRVFLARLDGRVVGALTLLLYKDLVTYWYTGTLRGYATYRAGDLLAWHAIEFGHSRGYRSLDFGGAGRPDEPYGVRDFKAKFGGRLVDFGRDVWVRAPLRMRLAKAGYERMRGFLR
jgi:CelD/BcsL family acetyltransferase involved in cellulose biosynthesis